MTWEFKPGTSPTFFINDEVKFDYYIFKGSMGETLYGKIVEIINNLIIITTPKTEYETETFWTIDLSSQVENAIAAGSLENIKIFTGEYLKHNIPWALLTKNLVKV